MSTTTALIPTTAPSTSHTLAPSAAPKQPASSPSATSTSALPKLGLTPQSKAAAPAQPPTSTPQHQPSPAASTPGQWQHPRMDEVIRRQNATHFDMSNMKLIGVHVGLIFTSFLAPLMLYTMQVALSLSRHATHNSADPTSLPSPWIRAAHPYPNYLLLVLRLFFLANIAVALSPLFRKPDSCEDVPLTPAQRQLLGLPPMSRPATPLEQTQWVTPPRYSRSHTPKSATSSLRAQASGSPSSGRGMPFEAASPSGSTHRRGSASPLTPSGARGAERRRLSYTNRSSPLSTSEFDAVGSMSTPTKTNRASVGLNSKWLYEKGRGSPIGSGWGTGSVFN